MNKEFFNSVTDCSGIINHYDAGGNLIAYSVQDVFGFIHTYDSNGKLESVSIETSDSSFIANEDSINIQFRNITT